MVGVRELGADADVFGFESLRRGNWPAGPESKLHHAVRATAARRPSAAGTQRTHAHSGSVAVVYAELVVRAVVILCRRQSDAHVRGFEQLRRDH